MNSWVLALFVGLAATSQQASCDEYEFLTDRQFGELLLQNENIYAPIYFGCNRSPDPKATFPVACFHNGIQILISEIKDSDLNLWAFQSSIDETEGWERTFGQESLQFFDWSAESLWVWHYPHGGHPTLCVQGDPRTEGLQNQYVEVFDCLRFFPSLSGEAGRVIRVTFGDMGNYNLFGGPTKGDDIVLRSFVTYFMNEVFAL